MLSNKRSNFKLGFLSIEIMMAMTLATSLVLSLSGIIYSLSNRTEEISRVFEMRSVLEESKRKIIFDSKKDFLSIKTGESIYFEKGLKESIDVVFLENFFKKITLEVSDLNSKTKVSDEFFISDLKNYSESPFCLIDPQLDIKSLDIYGEVDLGEGIWATDIDIKNNFIFISADSASTTKEDLFIFKENENNSIDLVSKINTGPGLKALKVFGKQIYTANTSVNSQFQIINIDDIYNPKILSNLNLTNSSANGESLEYYRGKTYLGTQKSASSGEVFVIDVSDPKTPFVLNSFELNTQVSDILIFYDYLFVASPTQKQLRVFDISDFMNITEVGYFSSAGWQAQDGRSLFVFGDELYFGKTVGGFNNPNNYELFEFNLNRIPDFNAIFSSTTLSVDTASSVNWFTGNGKNIFVGLGEPLKKIFLVSDTDLTVSLEDSSESGICYKDKIYVAIKNRSGLRIIKPKYAQN